MCFRRLAAVLVAALWFTSFLDRDAGPAAAADELSADGSKPVEKIVPIYKTDAEWRKQLTPRQFEVTRRKGTELAHTGRYWHNKRPGVYRCICCDLDLFSSETKFESHTGWPSFWAPIDADHVKLAQDLSDLPARTEVLCARCDAHLGHVFGDGPRPSGLRYCLNSAALNFIDSKDKAPPRGPRATAGAAGRNNP